MIMIGQGERTQVIGPPELEHCLRCEEEREFVPQFQYSYGQIDLLFGFVYNRRYQLACPACSHGWKLEAKAAELAYGKPALPFHLRYGLLVLIGLIVLLGAAAYFHGHAA